MIIVHVAIVSEYLLASNNLSTSTSIISSSDEELGHEHRDLQRRATLASQCYRHDSPKWTWEHFSHIVLGWSNTFETEFSPVSLLTRGSNKMKCIRKIWSMEGIRLSEDWWKELHWYGSSKTLYQLWFSSFFLQAVVDWTLGDGNFNSWSVDHGFIWWRGDDIGLSAFDHINSRRSRQRTNI